jgi:hypothetical protein
MLIAVSFDPTKKSNIPKVTTKIRGYFKTPEERAALLAMPFGGGGAPENHLRPDSHDLETQKKT